MNCDAPRSYSDDTVDLSTRVGASLDCLYRTLELAAKMKKDSHLISRLGEGIQIINGVKFDLEMEQNAKEEMINRGWVVGGLGMGAVHGSRF